MSHPLEDFAGRTVAIRPIDLFPLRDSYLAENDLPGFNATRVLIGLIRLQILGNDLALRAADFHIPTIRAMCARMGIPESQVIPRIAAMRGAANAARGQADTRSAIISFLTILR